MKLTNAQLKQIIKEELTNVLYEGKSDSLEGQSMKMGRSSNDDKEAMKAVWSAGKHPSVIKLAELVKQDADEKKITDQMKIASSELQRDSQDFSGVAALFRYFSAGPFGDKAPGGDYDPLAIGVQLALVAADKLTRSNYSGGGRMDNSSRQKLERAANNIAPKNKRPTF